MTHDGYPIPVSERSVRANGLDIWYVEAGEGVPLLLLHGGTGSNGPRFAAHPGAWPHYLAVFADQFRVICPDTRGHGRTRNPSGAMGYALFAQDVIAFIDALGLEEQPLLCGMSDGGAVATLVSLLAPEVPRAVVNWAGVSRFNADPDAALYRSLRAFLGGSPDATRTNYDTLVQTHPEFDLRLREEDYEPAQGRGYVRTYLERAFAFATQPVVGYTLADFGRISAPTLVLVGDRDGLCPVAESAEAFQRLPRGELGVIPGAGHTMTQTGCLMALDFLLRHRDPF